MLDGLGHGRVDVDQVMGADGRLVPEHPLVVGQAQRQVELGGENRWCGGYSTVSIHV